MKKEYIAPKLEEIKLNSMILLAGSVNGGGDITDPPGWGGEGSDLSEPNAPRLILSEE